MSFVQSFLDWMANNKDALGMIGSAVVIVVGALWQLYVRRKKPLDVQRAPAPSTSAPVRIELLPRVQHDASHASVFVVEGRYPARSTARERNFLIFSSAFTAFWCLLLLWGFSSALGPTLERVGLSGALVVTPFLVGVLAMLHFGLSGFFSPLTLLCGKVRVIASPDIVLVSRSLGDFFASHTYILGSEWRFDGATFVSRRDGTMTALPELPDYVSSELTKVLSASWQ